MNIEKFKQKILELSPPEIPRSYLTAYFNSFLNSYYEIESLIETSDNILDVGCGPGLLVNYLSIKGFKIEGIDNYLYNPHSKIINEAINGQEKVKDCDIKDFVSVKKFDVIFLHNVIEHMDDWKKSMEPLNYSLNEGGKIVLLLPNYNFPIEFHVMLPIIFNKDLTYKLFKGRIDSFENKHNRQGIWESLNFVKPTQIATHYLNKGYTVKYEKTYFPNLLLRMIKARNKESVHRKNLIHIFLIGIAMIFCHLKIIKLYRHMPLFLHPFIKIVINK